MAKTGPFGWLERAAEPHPYVPEYEVRITTWSWYVHPLPWVIAKWKNLSWTTFSLKLTSYYICISSLPSQSDIYVLHEIKQPYTFARVQLHTKSRTCHTDISLASNAFNTYIYILGQGVNKKVLILNWPWSKHVPLDPSWTKMPFKKNWSWSSDPIVTSDPSI